MKKIAVVLLGLTLLTGCAVKGLSPDDREHTKTISILPVQWKDAQFQYTSMQQAWGAGLGAGVGAASGMATGVGKAGTAALTGVGTVEGSKVGVQAPLSDSAAILNTMKVQHLDMGEILQASFEQEITRDHLFRIAKPGEPADATVEIIISSWGFSLKNYSSELYPVIGAMAVMKRGDVAIWRNFDTVSPFNDENNQAFLPQTYAADPAILHSALSHVSSLVSKKLISHLKE